jgi:hypothetical protein
MHISLKGLTNCFAFMLRAFLSRVSASNLSVQLCGHCRIANTIDSYTLHRQLGTSGAIETRCKAVRPSAGDRTDENAEIFGHFSFAFAFSDDIAIRSRAAETLVEADNAAFIIFRLLSLHSISLITRSDRAGITPVVSSVLCEPIRLRASARFPLLAHRFVVAGLSSLQATAHTRHLLSAFDTRVSSQVPALLTVYLTPCFRPQ